VGVSAGVIMTVRMISLTIDMAVNRRLLTQRAAPTG
jgi:hypothetical protein